MARFPTRRPAARALGAGLLALAALAGPGSAPAAAQEACGTYTVQRGDTLRQIAIRVFGNDDYRALYALNRARMGGSADALEIGQVLLLPCAPQVPDGAGSPAAPGDTARRLPPPPEPVGADDPVRFLSAGDMPPFADPDLPGGGLLPELIRRVMDSTTPPRAFRIDTVRDRDAQAALLLPMGAFDLGMPWLRPDCRRPLGLPEAMQTLCERYAFSDPLISLDLVYYGDPEAGTVCLPGAYAGPDPLDAGLLPEGTTVLRGSDCTAALAAGEAGALLVNREMQPEAPAGLAEQPGLSRLGALVLVADRETPQAMERLAAFNAALARVTTDTDWPEIVARTLADWRGAGGTR